MQTSTIVSPGSSTPPGGRRRPGRAAPHDGVSGLILRECVPGDFRVTTLRGGVTVLSGAGGNIAVTTGPDGKVMVDAGVPASRPQVSDALAALGPAPVRYVISTHWHHDHTGGNAWVREQEGATVIAHVKTWDRISSVPGRESGLPGEVFAAQRCLNMEEATLELSYYGPAHTDTDISVHFTEADVLHVGDTWVNGSYPVIDYSTGGSFVGMIRATDENLERARRDTLIVPGHGPVGTRDDLTEYRDMLLGVYERVLALKRRGYTLGEVVEARPTAAFDDRWGGSVVAPDVFAALVYRGV